ncbi:MULTISPECIES: Imm70 family immunity protein [unclassified Bacillus (in: firmicutes)]|uniref:Imm70 family immunity protein n=1 Tax=unclassified Bacillus (in: firmicutes) TaxID=185979 RepID=UPI0008EEFB33|nr:MULTISPECIES: Imm70 family immunity protein [unclassified Bacillus (in: firmicutes)]SFI36636.1 Immunity protein 70 [Bacillus sp. 71mf]SFT24396.1 Immunity protein 70 [Bacillus sp. 103mf]SFT24682.1 Immunity protein 70 [Bacillus sp. 103mf]
MSVVGFKVDMFFYEVGHPDLLHSFFSTMSYHTEPEGWGTKYPLLMKDLYFDKLKWKDAPEALKNIEEIREKLSEIPPSEVVWDIEDIAKRPPWEDNLPEQVTNLENYYATPRGTTFFTLLINALKDSIQDKMDVIIKKKYS